MQHIYETILKTSLKANLQDTRQLQKRYGGIFIVEDKSHFDNNVRGHVVTTYSQLNQFTNKATHWTPNAYSRYFYTNNERTNVAGFNERYLLQVNTFVVDIDTKAYSVNDILLACIDDSIGAPTMILESDNGYQVYFVMDKPIFMSNKKYGQIKKIVKRISENLKRSLRSVDADMFCNDFGFFRMPNSNNLVWLQLDQTYTLQHMIEWSSTYSDGRELYNITQKHTKGEYRLSDWYKALTSIKDAKGTKGAYGRNNLLFTIALTNYADGVEFNEAQKEIEHVNRNLREPLKNDDVERLLKSAYSGRYRGPAAEYVNTLLKLNDIRDIEARLCTKWVKHKKHRHDRERSHLSEWEDDLVQFLQNYNDEPCEMSQNQLSDKIGIPRASLNKLINISTKLFKRATGSGCKAKTIWLTITQVLNEAMKRIRKNKTAIQFVHAFIRSYNLDINLLKSNFSTLGIEENELSTLPLHISLSGLVT